jgi:hypothetical protein
MMNFKKAEIVSTEKNYDVHIFMHPSDDVGNHGFTIKKRKSLSDEERREIEMPITTGKVNQLGLEKSYFDGYSKDDRTDEDSDRGGQRRPRNNNNNKLKKNNRYDKKRSDNCHNNEPKKSFLGSIFSAFSK